MKKMLLISIILLFISCSSDKDSTSSDSTSINPPSWIQGSWYLVGLDGVDKMSGYSFKKNDFCQIVFNTQSCFKQSIDLMKSGGGYIKVDEVINDNEYKISITQFSTTTIYNFKKISATKIEWINDSWGDLAETYYLKQ